MAKEVIKRLGKIKRNPKKKYDFGAYREGYTVVVDNILLGHFDAPDPLVSIEKEIAQIEGELADKTKPFDAAITESKREMLNDLRREQELYLNNPEQRMKEIDEKLREYDERVKEALIPRDSVMCVVKKLAKEDIDKIIMPSIYYKNARKSLAAKSLC